ncbi:MAG: hypothetical protein CSA10_00180 [Cardiobacteriales bacterium]|nr:MAG: hypothetical protein CSA10_00180 [Cardiobacteriales bacterium]
MTPNHSNWKQKRFKELFRLDRGSSPRPIANYITDDKDGVNWIKIGDAKEDSIYIHSTKQKISKAGAKKSRQVFKGEIILSNSMSYGHPYLLNLDGYIHDGWFVIRDYEKNFDRDFLLQYLGSAMVKNQYKKLAVGGVVSNISRDLVYSIKAVIPPLPEQRKIARILAVWDKAIHTTKLLIDNSKQLKQALTQQLLTGQKRLLDDFGQPFNKKWENKTLREIGSTFNGLIGKTKTDFGFGKPYVPYLNIFRNTFTDMNHLDLVAIEKNETQNSIHFGDILFTASSETLQEVGMSSVYLATTKENIYLNSFCFGFRPFSLREISPRFIGYMLRSYDIRRQIIALSQGASRYNFSKTQLLKVSIPFPPLKEQQKIAAVLTNIDKKIDSLEHQVLHLRKEKKALVQQLLTGKIHVNSKKE